MTSRRMSVTDDDQMRYTLLIKKLQKEIRVYPEQPPSIGGIKAMYRSLRENCEYWLRHEEANEFYMRNGGAEEL